MHNIYPKYVFKGEYMALVRSAEERALLPSWADTPPEGFVCPSQAHFHSAAEVLAFCPPTPVDVEKFLNTEDIKDEEETMPVDEVTSTPGVSPKKVYATDQERIKAKREAQEARLAKARANSAAQRAAAKAAQ